MQADIQKSLEAGKLTTAAAEKLAQLEPGTFVQHKSWGYGRVAGVDFLVQQMTIDFKSKKSHPMQLQYAADSLVAIPAEHIAAQKVADLAGVKARAKAEPVSVARAILISFGGKATQDQIATALVPEVMTEAEFKRWFETAKKAMKNDGHFAIPTKKGMPFELREGPISHTDEYLAAFGNARQLKEQIKAVELILKHIDEFKNGAEQLQPVIVSLNDAAKKSAKLRPDETLALLATRDELLDRVPGLERGTDAPEMANVLTEQRSVLSSLLSKVPDSKLARCISALPGAFGEEWLKRAIFVVLNADKPRLAAEAAALIAKEKQNDELGTALQRDIASHSISSAALCWLCDDRLGWFSDLLDSKMATAIIAALERDAHAERKDRKLHDILVKDQDLLPELLAGASVEERRDYMRKLLLTTVFEELNKRSLLGRIIRIYPDMQGMISGESEKDESDALIVSWESLEAKKAEFDELVTKKIPENVKEIQVARSYGDLRENFEFKAAKEMQRVLNRRRSDMERDLGRARGTDFANADTNHVSIGTTVTLRETDGRLDVYSILGAWDTRPEGGIVSYQSALAKALLGKKVGDTCNAPTEHGDRVVVIEKIETAKR